MIMWIGIATAMNLIIIFWKIEKKRYYDGLIDVVILVLLAWVFGSTITGLSVGSVASCIFSLYLLYKRPDDIIRSAIYDVQKEKKKKEGKNDV